MAVGAGPINTAQFANDIEQVPGRLCLGNDVSAQALAPIVIVTLRAGNIQLPLTTFEQFTADIEKRC